MESQRQLYSVQNTKIKQGKYQFVRLSLFYRQSIVPVQYPAAKTDLELNIISVHVNVDVWLRNWHCTRKMGIKMEFDKITKNTISQDFSKGQFLLLLLLHLILWNNKKKIHQSHYFFLILTSYFSWIIWCGIYRIIPIELNSILFVPIWTSCKFHSYLTGPERFLLKSAQK